MHTGVCPTLEPLLMLRRHRNLDEPSDDVSSWPAWWSTFVAALSCSRPATTIASHQTTGACDVIKPACGRKSNEWSLLTTTVKLIASFFK